MPLPTASSLQLGMTCPGATALPGFKRGSNFGSRRGQGKHNKINAFIQTGEHPDDDEINWDRVAELADPCGGERTIELAFRWKQEGDKVTLLGQMLNRNYPEKAYDEIDGTADVVIVHPDHVEVKDWKTGRTWIPRPKWNWQIKFLCYCAARHFGKKKAVGSFYQLDKDYPQTDTFDEMDLEEIGFYLRKGVDRMIEAQMVQGADADAVRPYIKTGAHCEYCASFADCPAQVGTAQALVEMEDRLPMLTPILARQLWEKLVPVKSAVTKVERALLPFVREAGPIALENGNTIEVVMTKPREYPRADAALPILQAEGYGLDEIAQAMNLVQWKLEKLVGKDDAQRILDQIRKAGGCNYSKPNEVLKEIKKKE